MTSYRELLEWMRRGAGTLVDPVDYATVCALWTGFNVATSGAALDGFHKWLLIETRAFGGSPSWPRLVLNAAFPDRDRYRPTSAEEHAHAIATLHDLLERFWAMRDQHDGRRRIYAAHEAWLREKSWYGPDMPNWIDTSASPEQILAGASKKRGRAQAARKKAGSAKRKPARRG